MDPYLVALAVTVALAFVAPARGVGADALGYVVQASVAGLFLLYGARLSTLEVKRALRRWPPQLAVLSSTYVLFPVVAWGLLSLFSSRLAPELVLGIVFLSIVPSTVQSSIAFTALAGGNVAAALTSATLSNLSGVLLTPLLASALLGGTRGVELDLGAVRAIALQILLPFALGQLLRPRLSPWLAQHKKLTLFFDRGSILLLVYSAFSAGQVAKVWTRISLPELAYMALVLSLLLSLILGLTFAMSRLFRFEKGDEIAVVFCGSKKSMASGIPMANVLFSPLLVGQIVLPLMFFHQLQLFVCAFLAGRYARRLTQESTAQPMDA